MVRKDFKSGYVALLGKPNVGKSTILNYFLKEKLSIISKKPQTTRDSILGILSGNDYQIIFVDTPGIHKPKTKLGEHMVSLAMKAGNEADEVIVVVDASTGITGVDRKIFQLLKTKKNSNTYTWFAVIINKVDLIRKQKLLSIIDICRQDLVFDEYIPVSAQTGYNLDFVLKKIKQMLPVGPAYYPQEQLTDKSQRYIIAETIREQLLDLCHEEIPHSVAVKVNAVKDTPGRKTLVQATIFLERNTQKGIVLGKDGQMLKKIGTAARRNIEQFLDKKIYLELWVKVHKNWRKNEAFLKSLGYKKN